MHAPIAGERRRHPYKRAHAGARHRRQRAVKLLGASHRCHMNLKAHVCGKDLDRLQECYAGS